jgi:L-fuculose-phosphate aldolase
VTTARRDLAAEVIATAREMARLGLVKGTSGNVSARHADGFLITPTGVDYDALEPGRIPLVALDGAWTGDWKPSSEWRMHADIYRTRPEAMAVVHTHSTHATALSMLRRDVPAAHYMLALAGGPTLRCAAYATYGTRELSDAMLAALAGRRACLLANHGFIGFESDLRLALRLAEEMEEFCRQYILARQVGEPAILDDAEMARVVEKFRGYGR